MDDFDGLGVFVVSIETGLNGDIDNAINKNSTLGFGCWDLWVC